MKTLLIILAVILGMIGTAHAFSAYCPIHDGVLGLWQGSRTIGGVLVNIYSCVWGHTFAVKAF